MARNIEQKVTRILSVISEHGYVTQTLIGKIVRNLRTGYRYVNLLKEFDYVEAFPSYSSGSEVFCLTKKGWLHLATNGAIRVLKNFTKSDYTVAQFFHTVAGVEVRLIFEQHPFVVDYRPSRVLKYFAVLNQPSSGPSSGAIRGKQCDAEMILQTPKNRYAVGIEIELTQKKTETIAKMFTNLSAYRQDLSSVLWLCGSEAIIKSMQETYKRNIKNLTSKPEQYFILLDDFKAKEFEAEWVDVDGNKLTILPPLEQVPQTQVQQQ